MLGAETPPGEAAELLTSTINHLVYDAPLEKLERLREQLSSDVLLEIDGGINQSTIQRSAKAGAQLLVVGSAIFRSSHYGQAVKELTELALAR